MFIANNYPDYDGNQQNLATSRVATFEQLFSDIEHFLKVVNPKLPIGICSKENESDVDTMLYEGAGSHLYAFLKIYKFFTKISLK